MKKISSKKNVNDFACQCDFYQLTIKGQYKVLTTLKTDVFVESMYRQTKYKLFITKHKTCAENTVFELCYIQVHSWLSRYHCLWER